MSSPADLPSFDDLAPATGGARPRRGVTGPTEPGAAGAGPAAPSADGGPVDATVVAGVLEALEKALRAQQLYQENNQVHQRFLGALRTAFSGVWGRLGSLELTVEDHAFVWEEVPLPAGEGRDNLAFLFYKDGIRRLTFLPGFEDEVGPFLDILNRARLLDRREDDLVTLLWEQDFAFFRYVYVDVLAEGLAVPDADPVELGPLDRSQIVADAAEGEEGTEAAAEPAPAVTSSITRADFQETLYFLDDAELAALQSEVDREWARDVKSAVIHALADRLEDRVPARQREILDVFRQLLPGYLAAGDFAHAAAVLRELDDVASRGGFADDDIAGAAAQVVDELSDPQLLERLVRTLDEGQADPDPDDLSLFLSHLRPAALPVLIRASERAGGGDVRDRLQAAIVRLADEHPRVLVGLLDSDEAAVARGAARLAGRTGLEEAVRPLCRLLEHEDAGVRLAAVDSLVAFRSAEAVEALQRALEDPDREVRITAARGLGTLRYQPARSRFEEILASRGIRKADLTEKIAFFEAYGALGSARSVEFLDGILNGRGLLGRRQPSEIRACAALALGKIGTPAARAALERAGADDQAMVRSAVARALGGAGGGT